MTTKLIELPENVAEDFKIELTCQPGTWTVKCTGTLDHTESSSSVQPALLKLHEILVAEGVKLVELDMHAVEYMNSSGLKGFMTWFLHAEREGVPAYQIEVFHDPKRSWQGLSLGAMAQVAAHAVRMKERAAQGKR